MDHRYPDLRYKFIRGLIDRECGQRQKKYLKNAAEWTSKAIVSLDLAEEAVKSVKQASKLEGIGVEISKELKVINASGIISLTPPKMGMFCSSASALVVSMVLAEEMDIDVRLTSAGSTVIPEATLKRLAGEICEEKFRNVTGTDGNGAGFCPAWWRLTVLITRELVKKRSLNKETVYELLPAGKQLAARLIAQNPAVRNRKNLHAGPVTKGVPAMATTSYDDTALYSNDTGRDGVILLVDTQEWGGERVGLSELIRLLDRTGVTYKTQKLACADYQWIWRHQREERTLPVLVERKRADDLARSLRDGRYLRQKRNMMAWRDVFGGEGVPVSLKYLVEGRPEDYAVRCIDGCGAVVKCGYPTVTRIKEVLRELGESPDFDLLETEDIQATANLLALITKDLQHRVRNGDFTILMGQDIGKAANKLVSGTKAKKTNPERPSADTNLNLQLHRKSNVQPQAPKTRADLSGVKPSTADIYNASIGRGRRTEIAKVDMPLVQYHSAMATPLVDKPKVEEKVFTDCARGVLPSFRTKYSPRAAVPGGVKNPSGKAGGPQRTGARKAAKNINKSDALANRTNTPQSDLVAGHPHNVHAGYEYDDTVLGDSNHNLPKAAALRAASSSPAGTVRTKYNPATVTVAKSESDTMDRTWDTGIHASTSGAYSSGRGTSQERVTSKYNPARVTVGTSGHKLHTNLSVDIESKHTSASVSLGKSPSALYIHDIDSYDDEDQYFLKTSPSATALPSRNLHTFETVSTAANFSNSRRQVQSHRNKPLQFPDSHQSNFPGSSTTNPSTMSLSECKSDVFSSRETTTVHSTNKCHTSKSLQTKSTSIIILDDSDIPDVLSPPKRPRPYLKISPRKEFMQIHAPEVGHSVAKKDKISRKKAKKKQSDEKSHDPSRRQDDSGVIDLGDAEAEDEHLHLPRLHGVSHHSPGGVVSETETEKDGNTIVAADETFLEDCVKQVKAVLIDSPTDIIRCHLLQNGCNIEMTIDELLEVT